MSENARLVAIVTGAGSGIGLEAARQLSGRGWAVVLAGRTRTTLDAAGASLTGEWIAIDGDIGDEAFVKKLLSLATARFGGVDAIVNAAGVAALAPIPDHTSAMIRETFFTNAIGPAMLMAAAWPILRSRGGGCIVNVSSMASIDPFDGFFAYAATKSALNMLTTVGAREGRASNIRCYCVAPGAVETGMLRSMFSKQQVSEEAALSPAEIARVIVECVLGARKPFDGEPIILRR
jgi:NAD(P)-dependent dehydrogenase (short-subunit alcohol dehydrogenase family)